jgi:hypothetical protein
MVESPQIGRIIADGASSANGVVPSISASLQILQRQL